eukprot:365286-Chlamydomonas_euryale.AAC.2
MNRCLTTVCPRAPRRCRKATLTPTCCPRCAVGGRKCGAARARRWGGRGQALFAVGLCGRCGVG